MSDRRWCPDKCPITGRPFFCWIEDEDGTQVPTYGGPFDSYTIPEQDEDGEFTVKHYDHDLGGWRDYMNLGVRLIEDQREDHEWGTVEALQARIAELDAAIALMRGQSELLPVPRAAYEELLEAIDALDGYFTDDYVQDSDFDTRRTCCGAYYKYPNETPHDSSCTVERVRSAVARLPSPPKDTADEQ